MSLKKHWKQDWLGCHIFTFLSNDTY